jgi:hypothetical protein
MRSLVAGCCDKVVSAVEAFVDELSNRLADALTAPIGDPSREFGMKMVIGPDLAGMHQELARLLTLVQSRELRWI